MKYLIGAIFALFIVGCAGCTGCAGRSAGGSDSADTVAARPDTLALAEGLRLFEHGDYELAREQLLVSAASSGSYIRAESFLYLNALEMELGNYNEARPWLERYHAETVRLLRGAAAASARAEQQAARLRRRHDTFVAGLLILAAGAAAIFVFKMQRRRRVAAPNEVIATPDEAPVEEFNPASWQHHLAGAEAFMRTEIWGEIAELAAQSPGREARVLTSARQDVLETELAECFGDLAAELKADFPTLTAGDIKLCCLSLLPLSPFGRAICWGSTETNIIKQRKHTIKRKMVVSPRGSAIFAFIFDRAYKKP